MTSTKNNETQMYAADGIPLNDAPATAAAITIPTTTTTPTAPSPAAVATPMGPARVENSPYIHVTSRSPITMTHCPRCAREHANTRVNTEPTGLTWLAVLGVCCICWPFFWAPLVIDDCKQTNHYCVGCGAEVGSVKPFQ
jgi:hypothetical protein